MINCFRRALLLMGRIFHHREDPVARSGMGVVLDEEQSCGAVVADGVGGVCGRGWAWGPTPPLHLPPSLCPQPPQNEPKPIRHFPKPLLDNSLGRRNPVQTEEARRGRESFATVGIL